MKQAIARAEFMQEGWLHQEHRWELEPLVRFTTQRLDQSDQQIAYLANQTALALYHLCRYAEAEPLYRRALEIREKVLGPDHLETKSIRTACRRLYFDALAALLLLPGFLLSFSFRIITKLSDPSRLTVFLCAIALGAGIGVILKRTRNRF